MTVFFTGGGTAGHIYAGVALADRLKATRPGIEVRFIGARGGMEERLVPRAGYPLHLIDIGSFNGVSLSRRIRTLVQIPWSFVRSFGLLLAHRPKVVLGVGGYASFPMVFAAGLTGWLWGARVAILEQNVLPGLTNRILGRIAGRVFAAFPGSEKAFGSGKVLVTGNPVRGAMQPLAPATRDPFTVFVFGGSQGAVGVNSLVIDALGFLGDCERSHGLRLRWIHQTGERDYERVRAAHEKQGTAGRVEKFLHDMPECYAQASLLVCRAGSSTLSEVAAVGRASVLIPLVSADRHQEYNAGLFARSGAAEMRLQGRTTGEELARLILELAKDTPRIDAMEKSAARFARPDAVDRILAELFPATTEGAMP